MSTTKLAVPMVHLGGTSYDTLSREYADAAHAVRAAMNALREVTLHERDYHVQPSGVWETAVSQFMSRYDRLHSVRVELDQISRAMYDNQTEGRHRDVEMPSSAGGAA